MPTESERMYWRECWPEGLKNVLKRFMEEGNGRGLAGLSSLAVCHRKSTDYEAAVTVLIREILRVLDEARVIRERLAVEGAGLREDGTYEAQERLAEILGEGLIPSRRLSRIVQGYRRVAREIYLDLRNDGFVRIEERELARSRIECVGLSADWNGLLEDIRIKGMNDEKKGMWASSMGIMLCLAETGKGITKILPMALGMLEASRNDGKISFDELYAHHYANVHHGKRELEMIIERQKEKIAPLKIFPSEAARGVLIVNPNTIYGVIAWRREANRLARMRGLTVA